ncbi:alpha-crystallin A chain [Parasteatoda tepidariorum]|uniref:Protein lethal(2)essential for life n=1 Tax=Parasteatoda tepidariorum TaxID=114398 RepID=A0A2L2YG38_PARTP|nr:alpha-crystallin A chain [Parasteatoda tepidariorum]
MAFSLLPLLTGGNSWWDTWDYPSTLLDQHFGMGLLDSDLRPPQFYRGYLLRPRTQMNIDASGLSEVKNEKDKFQVKLNVSHFKPEEINVKAVDNSIVIHGKHEEKSDEHGFISREFTRRYMLPEGTEPETVTSTLTPDGCLVIEAPKKAIEPPPSKEKVIPIDVQKSEDK